YQQACPFWVPLVENNEINSEGAHYFVQKDINELLSKSPDIDTIVLACTHYPILYPIIRKYTPDHIQILAQGELVADSMENYLPRRVEVERRRSNGRTFELYSADGATDFTQIAKICFGKELIAKPIKVAK